MNFVGYPTLVLRDGKKFVNTTRVYATGRHNLRTAKFRMATTTESNMPTIHFGQIQHAGMLVKDVLLSKEFYMNIFGMTDDTDKRGNLPFPGAFLRAGASQIHLMQLPNPDPLENRAEHGGRYVKCKPKRLSPVVFLTFRSRVFHSYKNAVNE